MMPGNQSYNWTEQFKYNVSTNPQDPSFVFQEADRMMGGGFAAGMMGSIWLIVTVALMRLGYEFRNASLAGNVVCAFGSFILYLGEWMAAWIPAMFIVLAAGNAAYNHVAGAR